MTVNYSKIKSQLESKLRELEDRAVRLEQRLSDPGVADSEENAALHSNDEVLSGLSDLTEHDIHEIRLALNRIEHGTYGVCSDCGSRIPQGRLEAMPFTCTCIACAQ